MIVEPINHFMKKVIAFALAVLVIIAYSCKKETKTEINYVKEVAGDVVNHFPLQVGNYWIYRNYNLDSQGTATPTNDWDSAFISKDTLIRGLTYYKMNEKNFLILSDRTISYQRDSLGYLVDSHGNIRFAENNFTDTLYIDSAHPDLYMGYATMWAKDSLVYVNAGGFLSSTVRMSVVPTRPDDPIPVRYTYDIYGKGVGRLKYHSFFYAGDKHFESRLERYHLEP